MELENDDLYEVKTVLIAGDNSHLFSTPIHCIGEENNQMNIWVYLRRVQEE